MFDAYQVGALYNPRIVNRLRLAELVSGATRLPLLAVPLFLAVGVEAAGLRGILWALLCVFLTSGLSLLYLVYLTRSGKVTDPRAIPRAERVGPRSQPQRQQRRQRIGIGCPPVG